MLVSNEIKKLLLVSQHLYELFVILSYFGNVVLDHRNEYV